MKSSKTLGFWILVLGWGFLIPSVAWASMYQMPQSANTTSSSNLGINRSTLNSSFTTSTGTLSTVDPTYFNNYTNGLTPNASTHLQFQQRPNLTLSAGAFLFELFTGSGSLSFTEKLFNFIGENIFGPIKSSLNVSTGSLSGINNAASATAAVQNPYQNLICTTGDCNPFSNFNQGNSTQDVFNYLGGQTQTNNQTR